MSDQWGNATYERPPQLRDPSKGFLEIFLALRPTLYNRKFARGAIWPWELTPSWLPIAFGDKARHPAASEDDLTNVPGDEVYSGTEVAQASELGSN